LAIGSTPRTLAASGRMVRNAFHLGLGQIATTALTMVVSATIARTLGAADFGLLYLLTSIATFSYVFVDWGHGPYLIREVARHPERSGELLGSVLAVRAVTAVVVGAAAVFITSLLGYDVRTRVLTALLIAAWLPMYIALSYAWVFRGRERMDFDALISVVLKFATLITLLIFLWLGGRLVAIFFVSTGAGVITWILAMSLYRRLGLPPLRVTRCTARELIRNGASMLAIALVVAVQPYIDANILYKLAPRGVVGWYAAAWVIAGTLVAPASILGAAMYPRLSKTSGEQKEFRQALRRAFRPLVLVAVLGAVGTFLFADVAIGVVYSKQQFGPAGVILRVFAPVLVLIYIDMFLGHAILAAGKAGRLAAAKVAAVLVTTGVELVLVPWCQARFENGGLGIMLAMTAGELVMVTAAVRLIREVVDRSMFLDLLRALVAGTATIVIMRTLLPVSSFVGIPVSVLVFLAVSVGVGLLSRSDFDLLAMSFRRSSRLSTEGAAG
jgi:O-antigen/teichoic acid export membrane protein